MLCFCLLRFLDEVQSESNENKMSVQNLATVFGPNILRPRVEDPVTMMEGWKFLTICTSKTFSPSVMYLYIYEFVCLCFYTGSSQVQHLMTVLISEHSRLYQREEPEPGNKIAPIQRFKVEWLSQEDTEPTPSSGTRSKTPTEKPQSTTPPTDSTLNASSPVTSEKGEDGSSEGKGRGKAEDKVDGKADSKSEGQCGDEVAVSPSKHSKPLPSWRSSFKGGAAPGGPRGKIGGSAGDVSSAGGSNWLMNGLSSLRAHRRTTSSGERLKDSSLSLKDSTLSLKETTLSLKDSQRDSDEDSSRTPLSHRVLHQSHRLSAYDNVAPSSLSLPADTPSIWTSFEIPLSEPNGSDKAVKLEQGPERPTEVRDSTNTLDHSASGNEDDITGTSEDLTSTLTRLKQELKQQRTSYETCIRK